MKKTFREKGKLAAACVMTASMLLAGCGGQEDAVVMSRAVNVNVSEAAKGTLKIESTYIGTVLSGESVNVVPLVSGVVEEVYAKVGSVVQEGDVLCQFDDTAAQLTLESAQAGLKSAQAGYNTAVQTYENAVVSSDISLGSSWDVTSKQTQDGIDTLQQTLDSAKESLEDYQKDKEDADAQAVVLHTQMESAKNAYIQAETKYQTAVALANGTQTATGGNAGGMELEAVLAASGLTAADISESGLTRLKEATENAKQNYADLATAYNGMLTKSASYESAIDTLEANIETLELNLAQTKELQALTDGTVKDDSKKAADSALEVAKTGIESAKSGIESAQAGVDAAQYQVSLYSVTAPVSGTISAVNVEENNLFANNVAFTITNPDSRMVIFYVTDEVADSLSVGQAVTVENRGTFFDGKITEIGISVDLTTGLFKVKAVLQDAQALADYSNVAVTTVSHVAQEQIILPYDAVYFENGEAYVYVVEDGAAYRRKVEISIYDKERAAISEGIEAGERFVTSWASNLKDGVLINEVAVSAE